MRDNKRAQEARERAEEYKSRYGRPTINDETGADGSPNEGERQQPPGLRSPHDLDHWNDIVGQRVEEAIRQGHFDNLAGHGKPLDLSKNPFLPDDMQMANKLMENNNLIPGWIGERKSVLQAIDAFRQELTAGSAAYAKAKRALASPDEAIELATKWQRQLEAWQDKLRILNRRIEAVNIEQPVRHIEIFKLIFEREVEKAASRVDAED